VLVLIAAVGAIVPVQAMIEDLADATSVNPHGLDREHLQGPEAAKTDVSETGGDITNKPSVRRRNGLRSSAPNVRLGPFHRSAEVQLRRIQHPDLRPE